MKKQRQDRGRQKVAMAIGAHPDDIEFLMAGTLLQLKEIGYQVHYMTLANGDLGSSHLSVEAICRVRTTEAKAAAGILGACYHPPLCRDMQIFYQLKTLRRLAAVIRKVKPTILLTHPPSDYMEDHRNTCRLAVSAAFVRGVPNFDSTPPRKAQAYPMTVYHAMPHGLHDELGRLIRARSFINTAPVHAVQRRALEAHQSQHEWLGQTQGLNSYVQTMVDFAKEMGRNSGKFSLAEGWCRHNPMGFCGMEDNPLEELGKDYLANPAYEECPC